MTKILKHILVIAISLSWLQSAAQPTPGEIKVFNSQDSMQKADFPGKRPIVFAGSSSFRMWTGANQAFPSYPIINTGYGGSRLFDVIRDAEQVIFKYNPKQVVIYCGENDFMVSDTVTGKLVYNRFVTLFNMIRSRDKKTSVVFVSIKPSPSRMSIQPEALIANALIKKFLSEKKRTGYVDVYNPMLNADGGMREELYLQDRLHMKPAGYVIWKKAIEPYLMK